MSLTDTPRLLENRCYDELAPGDSASITRTLTKQDIELFAILSGDVNPAHLDEAYARETPFHKVIAHGMWGGTLISTVLGTRLPGPGTIYVRQSLAFVRPVGLGDVVTVTVTVKDKLDKHRVILDCLCSNQAGKPVITGEAEVIAPDVKVRRQAAALPELQLHHHERFARLMARTQGMPPAVCAVVHPLDLRQARRARDGGLGAGRRISHACIADVPGRDEPLLITDDALNIQPTLDAKRDIAQNAIDLALKMGLSPRVAVLSAASDPGSRLASSLDATALCKMAEQGRITGGIVDGPLPLDAAISPEAARVRHADSPVAGRANVLLVPNLETGDMLVKQLVRLAHADVAGIVLGAQVPVILQGATDTPRTRLASAALALLQARAVTAPTTGN